MANFPFRLKPKGAAKLASGHPSRPLLSDFLIFNGTSPVPNLGSPAHMGTVTGTVTPVPCQISNCALKFNGTTGTVQWTGHLSGVGAIEVVFIPTTTTNQEIVNQHDGATSWGSNNYRIFTNASSQLVFHNFIPGGTGTVDITATAPLVAGVPYHIVGVVRSGSVQLYINGVLAASRLATSGPTEVFGSPFFNAGRFNTAFSDGVIPYCRTWTRALDASEVRNLANNVWGMLACPAVVPWPRTVIIPTVVMTASMGSFAGATLKSTAHVIAAGKSSFAGAITRSSLKVFTATKATCAGAVTKVTSHWFHGARRNLFDESENLFYFNNNGAGFSGFDATTGADGVSVTADRGREDVGVSEHYYVSFMGLGAGTYTLSFYLKKDTINWAFLRSTIDGVVTRTWFDIFNGTVGTTGHASAAISNAGSGWFRCSVTFTTLGGSNSATNFGWGFASANGVFSYSGSTSNTTFVWGAQAETGALTTYQPMPNGDTPAMASLAGAVLKSTAHQLTASMGAWAAALVGSLLRLVTLTASMGPWTGTVSKNTLKALAATRASFSGTVSKLTQRSITAASSSFAGTVARGMGRTITASMSSFDGTVSRLTLRTLSATKATWAGVSSKLTSHTFTASKATFAGAVSRMTGKALSATSSVWTATLNRFSSYSLAASMGSWTATVNKSTTHTFNAALSSFAATLGRLRTVAFTMSASMAAWSGSINRDTSRTLPAQIGFEGSVSRDTSRTINASPDSWAAGVAKGVQRTLTATMGGWIGTLGRLLRQIANYIPRIRFRFGSESRTYKVQFEQRRFVAARLSPTRIAAQIRTLRFEEKRTTKIT